jgi:hypothetical protein
MGFEQVFNRKRRDTTPATLPSQLRRIDMGMPVDNHDSLLNLFKPFKTFQSFKQLVGA